jgi:hypothetical protein
MSIRTKTVLFLIKSRYIQLSTYLYPHIVLNLMNFINRPHDRVTLKNMKSDWLSCLDSDVGFKVMFSLWVATYCVLKVVFSLRVATYCVCTESRPCSCKLINCTE